ncbi:TM2 domain-containing protein [Rhodococcus daqingensis]|uniref:TM2 domain-containing protein n=1 Tax=Rhodococcus daqingensis TaxID=2479363 RepID=A0ABW2RYX7_9NOCA
MSEVPEGGSTPGPVYGPEGTGPGWPVDAGSTAAGQEVYGQQPYPPQPTGQQPFGQQTGPQQPFGQPAYGQQQYSQQQYGQQPYGQPAFFGADAAAPYGRDPFSGEPLSDKSKLVAGLLQIFLGAFGVGRFYTGHIGMAIAQIAVTWVLCGLGAIWPLIDGIVMLAGNPRDAQGRKLRS